LQGLVHVVGVTAVEHGSCVFRILEQGGLIVYVGFVPEVRKRKKLIIF